MYFTCSGYIEESEPSFRTSIADDAATLRRVKCYFAVTQLEIFHGTCGHFVIVFFGRSRCFSTSSFVSSTDESNSPQHYRVRSSSTRTKFPRNGPNNGNGLMARFLLFACMFPQLCSHQHIPTKESLYYNHFNNDADHSRRMWTHHCHHCNVLYQYFNSCGPPVSSRYSSQAQKGV